MKKTVSILLIVAMIMSFMPVFADEGEMPVLDCEYDTFIEGGNLSDASKNSKSPIVFSGDVYDRTVFFEFDISAGIPENARGAVLSFYARPSAANISVTLYGCDSIEDFNPYSKSISVYKMTKSGKLLCSFSVLEYIKEFIEKGLSKATFAVRSSADVLPIFSADSSNKADRPTLSYTAEDVFIKGVKDFEYPEVTSAQLSQDIRAMQAGGHPYTFFRKADLEQIRANINGGNEFLAAQYAGVKAAATKHLSTKPPVLVDMTKSYLSQGFNAWDVVSKCAFVYLIDGDDAYAQRAYDEAAAFATLPDLGTYQFIDNSQAVFAGALAYDWLYDWMDETQRETIKQGFINNHFNIVSDLFKTGYGKGKYTSSRFSAFMGGANHSAINNTVAFLGALAFADDDNVTYYADIMEKSLNLLHQVFDNFYPDSAWYEGASYWTFVGPYIARMFAAMKSGLGTWYGYEQIPCIVNASDYQIYAQSNQGYFMVGDTSQGKAHSVEKYYFAIMKNDNALKKLVLDVDKPTNSPFLCIWYDTEIDHDNIEGAKISLDKFFRNTDQVIFRDTWEGNQELYTGMAVIMPSRTHAHMASGTIGLDALGERWITNQGGEAYGAGYFNNGPDEERWKYHATRAEANSCLVINPSEFGGQNIYSEDTIDKYVSGNDGSYAWADLTETYKGQVSDYKRGLMLTNNRRTVILQDEVKLTAPSEVYSFINFYISDFEIAEDGKTVTVTKGNKKLRLNIICDQEYEVSTMRFASLPTSNPMPGSKRNKDIKKLVIRFPEASEINLRVEMTPYLFDEELASIGSGEFVPLADWKVEESENEIPRLADLKVNGQTIDGFNAYNRCYELPADATISKVEAIAAGNASAEVTKLSDTVTKIVVTDKADSSNINTYIIYTAEPAKEANIIDVSSLKEHKFKSVVASSVPQEDNKAANVLDGDLSTRWSATVATTGEESITLALDKAANANCVAIAFYDGSTRIAYFDLLVSADGKNWETIGEYDTSGATDDYEYYDLGNRKVSHVKIVGYGTNTGSWVSISDVKLYGK